MIKKLYLLIIFASMAFLLAGCPPKETKIEDQEKEETISVKNNCNRLVELLAG